MSDPTILIESADGIDHLGFNRHKQLNAFNNVLMTSAIKAVGEPNAAPNVQVMLVSGEERSSSAGFDLKAASDRSFETS